MPIPRVKRKQMMRGPHKSQFLRLLMASSLSPGIMKIVYLILVPTLITSFFWVNVVLQVYRWSLLRRRLHWPSNSSGDLNYNQNQSLYQVFAIVVDILIVSLYLLDHCFLLGRRTLHIQSAHSAYHTSYIFWIGSFFSLFLFFLFYSSILLNRAASSLFSLDFFFSKAFLYVMRIIQSIWSKKGFQHSTR